MFIILYVTEYTTIVWEDAYEEIAKFFLSFCSNRKFLK